MALLDLARPSIKSLSEKEELMGQLTLHTHSHTLYPPFFGRTDDLPKLDWTRVNFCPEEKMNIPKEKGVYAFVLEFRHEFLMNNSYVLYVGKAGDIKTKNTLYSRYQDYLRNQRNADRVRISDMLVRYDGFLSYYFSPVPDGISTGDVEKILLDILIPPYNVGDFSADLKALLKGANIL